jgi:uncharacterized protein YndB with AHSA1/START domain
MSWELKQSVIANASRQTVWEFISKIDNLARVEGDAVESMTLDGPFQAGARGTTKMRGQEPTHWRLAEVEPPERAVYEMELPGAVVHFNWTYEELTDGRTRLSQHIVLDGPGAEVYVPAMEQSLAPNVGKGMERIAEEIARYDAGQQPR